MEDILLAHQQFAQVEDQRNNFCRICWGPLTDCPGHVGYMEMFGPPPSDEQIQAYRADLEIRERGVERRYTALDAAAKTLGYDGVEDLCDKVNPE